MYWSDKPNLCRPTEATERMQAVRNLNSAPIEADLLELLATSANNPEEPCWLVWPFETITRLALGVITHAPGSRKNWHERGLEQSSEPEWRLCRQSASSWKDLWSDLTTRDLSLVFNLIGPESGFGAGSAKTQSMDTSSANTVAGQEQRIDFFNTTKPSLKSTVWSRLGIEETNNLVPNAKQSDYPFMLAGEITEIDVIDVLQCINVCSFTGKLAVFDKYTHFELFFAAGKFKQARSLRALTGENKNIADSLLIGDQAILDLFTWEKGTFQFSPGLETNEGNVTRQFHSLLMEGACLVDYRLFFAKQGMTNQTVVCLDTEHRNISEAELDKTLHQGIPSNLDLQKRIFVSIKVPTSLDQLARDHQLSKVEWFPIIFNLLSLKLIALA